MSKISSHCIPNDACLGLEPGDTGAQAVDFQPYESTNRQTNMVALGNLKAELTTFHSCGSSSRLVRRRNLPTRVTRGSFTSLRVWVSSSCT